jgi:hypothetical protein
MIALVGLLTLTANANPLTSASQHQLNASFNVALVSVSQDFTDALGASASAVVFDDSRWAEIIGNQESNAIERFSAINYTLAHKASGTANSVSVLLTFPDGSSEADFAALKVSLVVAGDGDRDEVVADSFLLKDYAEAPVARTIIQTSDAIKGVAGQNVPLRYTFQVDVTAGPSFPARTLTFVYTATAAAP